jgi:hypothetical protein
MAAVAVRNDRLIVHFSWWERLLVRRAAEEVPVAAIEQAEVSERWSYRPLGMRAGLVVAGLLKVGTWRSPGAARLVCVKRGLPTLRVAVDRTRSGGRFDEILISAPGARAAADALNARARR